MRQYFRLSLFAMLLALARAAAADSCPTPTPTPAGFKDFTFDLATGAPSAEISFPLNTPVRIVFLNRNPFLQYDIQIKSTLLGEPALTAFIDLFSDLAPLVKPKEAAAAGGGAPRSALTAAESAGGAQKDNSCWKAVTAAATTLEDAQKRLDKLNSSAADLQSKLSGLQVKFSDSQKVFESKSATCPMLQATGNRLLQAVDGSKLGDALKTYQADYDQLYAPDGANPPILQQLDNKLVLAEDKCTNDPLAKVTLSGLRTTQSALFGQSANQERAKQKQTLESVTKETGQKAKDIKDILDDPSNFITYRYVGPFDDRTKADGSIRIKKPSEQQFPKDTDYAFTLNFGGSPRFSISVGAAYSSLRTREYAPVQGFPIDNNGMQGTTLTRVVGLKDDSHQRITPMLLLNTRLWNGAKLLSGLHFSFGVSGKVDNKGTDVEYLAGFSFGFAENRALLTIGGYNGRVQKLPPGFHVGTELPKDVADVPVHKDRTWAPMIAVSYRIR